MSSSKRPKPKSRGARVPPNQGRPRRPKSRAADRSARLAEEFTSVVNAVLDEADRLAESIARTLGVRGKGGRTRSRSIE